MPLWLEQLLVDPELGLQLVAGKAGLTERGPVRWAHISEIPDPTPWLEGGEILLLTGLGIKDTPALQRRLIASLDRCGCAGVGFGLGVWVDAVPKALLDEADAREMPVFTVPYEVPFIAVTRRVSEAIAAEQYSTLRAAVDVHRQVLAAVIAGAGVKGVIETIAQSIPGFACLVFDYYGQPLATHGPDQYPRRLWQVVAPQSRRERFEFTWGDRAVTGALVRVGDEVEAVLVLVGPRPLAEHERLLMDQGLAGLSLVLARSLSVREDRRRRVSGLLGEVTAGRAAPDAVTAELERLGFRRADGFRVLCLRRPARVPERPLCALAEDTIGAAGRPIVGRWDDALYCIVQPADAPHAEHIAASARARGWSGVVVGISDDLAAEAFVRQTLGPVLDSDLLLGTLRAFLRHGCRPGPAAAELCVHRHTLAYRLDRIRDLCGRDPRDGTHLLEYGLALELHDRRR